MKKKNYPAVNMGSASLLVIFIILCLVTFATLSLSSATSDFHYSETIARRNTAYYEAANQAENVLAQLDEVFKDNWTDNQKDYYAKVQKSLPEIDGLTNSFKPAQAVITYQVPINDDLALKVELTLCQPSENDGHFYQVTKWQEISTKKRTGDNSIKVIGG